MSRRWAAAVVAFALLAVVMVAAVAYQPVEAGSTGVIEVQQTIDRQPSFTQGLELLGNGTMVHSRGLYGESGIDVFSPEGELLASADLPAQQFGEGVAIVPDNPMDRQAMFSSTDQSAYQLTWKSGVVHTWSLPDLVPGPSLSIDEEGWGLCYDRVRRALWHSDGTSTLRLRHHRDLRVLQEVTVTDPGNEGVEVDQLNELDCNGGHVWANIWKSDSIVQIEPDTGEVLSFLDLSDVVRSEDPPGDGSVLNGIAWSESNLLVTGKNWEHFYWVATPSED